MTIPSRIFSRAVVQIDHVLKILVFWFRKAAIAIPCGILEEVNR
jgi:hypothetical protein